MANEFITRNGLISLSDINVGANTISGSESAKFKLDTYAFGYNAFQGFGFDVTGSGIIISSSLPSEHYPMLKIGETELIDLTPNAALSDHTFAIHNIDNFQVSSGSEPIETSTNILFEHTGQAFKVYSKGNTQTVFNASSASVDLRGAKINLLPDSGDISIKVSNVSTTPQYVPVWDVIPNNPSGQQLKYITSSTFTGGGGGGNVSSTGTPANNQIAVWTNSNTIEGSSDFTFDAGALIVEGGGTTIFNNQNDDATFQIKGSSDDDLLQVNPQSNDRIGIGTTTPSEKLSVEGNVSASSYYGDGSNLTGISGGGGLSETPLANISGRFQWSSADDGERIHVGNNSYGPFNWYSFTSEPSDTNLRNYSAGTVDSTTAYVLDYHPVSYGIYVPDVNKKVKVRVSFRIQNGNTYDFGFSLWDCAVPANGNTSNNTVTLRAQGATQTGTADTTKFYTQEFTTTSAISDKYLFFLAENRAGSLAATAYVYANISFTLVD